MQRTFLKSIGHAAMKRVFQKGKAMQEEFRLEEICNLSELDCKVLDSVNLGLILSLVFLCSGIGRGFR